MGWCLAAIVASDLPFAGNLYCLASFALYARRAYLPSARSISLPFYLRRAYDSAQFSHPGAKQNLLEILSRSEVLIVNLFLWLLLLTRFYGLGW
jgi:hypothetical protein